MPIPKLTDKELEALYADMKNPPRGPVAVEDREADMAFALPEDALDKAPSLDVLMQRAAPEASMDESANVRDAVAGLGGDDPEFDRWMTHQMGMPEGYEPDNVREMNVGEWAAGKEAAKMDAAGWTADGMARGTEPVPADERPVEPEEDNRDLYGNLALIGDAFLSNRGKSRRTPSRAAYIIGQGQQREARERAESQLAAKRDPDSPESQQLRALYERSLGMEPGELYPASAYDLEAHPDPFRAMQASKEFQAKQAAGERDAARKAAMEVAKYQRDMEAKLAAEQRANEEWNRRNSITAPQALERAQAIGRSQASIRAAERADQRAYDEKQEAEKRVIDQRAKYGEKLFSEKIPDVDSALDMVEKQAAELKKATGEVGSGKYAMIDWISPNDEIATMIRGHFTSEQVQAFAAAQDLLNENFGRGQSGGAIGQDEKKAFAIITGKVPGATDAQFEWAIKTLRAAIERKKVAIGKAYPLGYEAYEGKPLPGQKGGGGGGGKKAAVKIPADDDEGWVDK